MRDWFGPFAQRETDTLEIGATGATRATQAPSPCEPETFHVANEISYLGNDRATSASAKIRTRENIGGDFHFVAQPLPKRNAGQEKQNRKLIQQTRASVAHVAHVAQENDTAPHEHAGNDWNTFDWQAFLDERAAIAQHDGGLSRAEAEARAYECCIVAWLNCHAPTQDDPNQCIHCGEHMAEAEALPFLTGDGGHVWMHSNCHSAWMARRRADATAALAIFGLRPQTGKS